MKRVKIKLVYWLGLKSSWTSKLIENTKLKLVRIQSSHESAFGLLCNFVSSQISIPFGQIVNRFTTNLLHGRRTHKQQTFNHLQHSLHNKTTHALYYNRTKLNEYKTQLLRFVCKLRYIPSLNSTHWCFKIDEDIRKDLFLVSKIKLRVRLSRSGVQYQISPRASMSACKQVQDH